MDGARREAYGSDPEEDDDGWWEGPEPNSSARAWSGFRWVGAGRETSSGGRGMAEPLSLRLKKDMARRGGGRGGREKGDVVDRGDKGPVAR